MSLTAQLGTADSTPGNLVLGLGGSAAPVYTAAVSGTVSGPSMTSAFTFVEPVYTAAVAGTAPGPTMVSAFTFLEPVYTAAVAGTMPGPTMTSQFLALYNSVRLVALTDSMYSGGY